jgi:hypothetical protein
MTASPELVDYLAFFEAEPKLITPGTEWFYGVEFLSVRGPDKIIATVAPDEGEFSFKWWHDNKLHTDLKFARVVSWSIESKNDIELLVLKFDQPKIPYFILQLKPHICVCWQVSWA